MLLSWDSSPSVIMEYMSANIVNKDTHTHTHTHTHICRCLVVCECMNVWLVLSRKSSMFKTWRQMWACVFWELQTVHGEVRTTGCLVRCGSLLCCVVFLLLHMGCNAPSWDDLFTKCHTHHLGHDAACLVFQTTPRVCCQWPQGGILGTFMSVGGEDASPSRWWAADGIQPLHHQ